MEATGVHVGAVADHCGERTVSLHVVLVEPQIAGNTGNIIRLCANVGASLHLVEPLGFTLDEAPLKRAGLDYHDLAHTTVYSSLAEAQGRIGNLDRWFALSAKAHRHVHNVAFADGDVFVFGTERTGLSPDVQAQFTDECRLRLPMQPANRSMNLSNACAVVVYEAWRQLGFSGAAPRPE
jgi:tRNA (cytidine/uridine-2'-O-)-methyltransferase